MVSISDTTDAQRDCSCRVQETCCPQVEEHEDSSDVLSMSDGGGGGSLWPINITCQQVHCPQPPPAVCCHHCCQFQLQRHHHQFQMLGEHSHVHLKGIVVKLLMWTEQRIRAHRWTVTRGLQSTAWMPLTFISNNLLPQSIRTF